MLRVFCANINEDCGNYDRSQLSQYRLMKLEKLNRPDACLRSVNTELLLIRSLLTVNPKLAAPLDIDCNEAGKPFLRGGEVCFSLSHSGTYGLCAVSDRELGADIQQTSKYNETLAKRFFADDEQRLLRAAENADGEFTRLWALKESYIKAVGLGLRLPLSSFSVVSGAGTGKWHMAHTRFGAYHAAVCSKDRIDSLNIEMIKLL